MPTYLYNCSRCGHRFELRRCMNGKDGKVACPEYGTREPVKIPLPFKSVAAVRFNERILKKAYA
jgi:putative FmdB family regulatory protein